MKQYNTFIFESHSFYPTEGVIELKYSLDDDIEFTETLTLPRNGILSLDSTQNDIQEALFMLHLMGGVSYYKTCCPKNIEIRSGTLTKEQAEFWNVVYTKGLGEFFYKNDIDFRGLVNFPTNAEAPSAFPTPKENITKRTLVPIGGGKDTIVTIEKLRKEGNDISLFRMGNHPIIEEIAKIADLPLLRIKRQLPQSLFELNEQGALNGHIPITGYLSALTVVTSLVYGFDSIAMSNEKSANEGNVEYLGEQINHQWSKSEEFETMFKEYVQKYVTSNVDYSSHLRNMTELEIAEEFCKHPEYFLSTTSCNANWRIVKEKPDNRWCGTCPKCAFVFCILAAHLPVEQLTEIFDGNLYDNESLIPLYKQLLGKEGFKPFECVGTPEETKEAFELAHKRGDMDDTPIMQMYLS